MTAPPQPDRPGPSPPRRARGLAPAGAVALSAARGPASGPARGIARRAARWAARVALAGLALAVLGAAALAVAVLGWSYPVAELAPERGGPLLITDRNGRLLRSVPGPAHRPGRSAWVPLERVPSHVLLAVIASEDRDFYEHAGVDLAGLARALWLDVRAGRFAYGGSTITMQLVRMLDPDLERRSVAGKIAQIVQALRLERAVDKRFILEQYVNRAYYGNGAYGIEAAARLYFDRPAASLSAGEATLLAVVPRAPTGYDPVRRLPAALRRRAHVLDLLRQQGAMSAAEIERASAQPLAPALHRPDFHASHFAEMVLQSLPGDVRSRGGVVRTTLDLRLQEALERRVREHVDALSHRRLQQAGVLVLDTQRGQVLAMVGSAGLDAPGGHIDVVTRRRHPGSALKPFVYALAIERGDSPATIAHDILDVPSAFHLTHLTQPERGPVSYREALAGSYNLAAVHVLEKVGVATLMHALKRAGAGPLAGDAGDYGLRLALGSTKVRLLDLAAAYGFLVRGGRTRAPVWVFDARSDDGRVWQPPRPVERAVFSPETSWLVMDILADPVARRRVFGRELPLDLPFPVAAKTGTARGFSDTVAIAVTSELTVAAWAGNVDGDATEGLIAMQSAAPLVRAGLLAGARERMLTLPEPPPGVAGATVCALSGMRPSSDCPHTRHEHFRAGTEPRDTCTWHRREHGQAVVSYPAEARAWAERERTRGGRHVVGQR
jgi:penicillin-binding protein 1C